MQFNSVCELTTTFRQVWRKVHQQVNSDTPMCDCMQDRGRLLCLKKLVWHFASSHFLAHWISSKTASLWRTGSVDKQPDHSATGRQPGGSTHNDRDSLLKPSAINLDVIHTLIAEVLNLAFSQTCDTASLERWKAVLRTADHTLIPTMISDALRELSYCPNQTRSS